MIDDKKQGANGAPATDLGQRSISRKDALTAGAAVAAGLAGLSALGGAETALASSPTRSSAATDVTLTMWSQDPLYVKFFKSRSTEFSALPQNKNYTISYNITQIPTANIFPKLLSTLAAGSGAPDIATLEINAFSTFEKGDLLAKGMVNLKPLIGSQYNDFLQQRWIPYTYKGAVYGVESGLSPSCLYYRQDILSKAGLKPPFMTYDDLVTAGRLLKKKTGQAILLSPLVDIATFSQMFQQVGGHYFNASGELTLDDSKAVSLLTYLVNGHKEGIFYGLNDPYSPPAFAAYQQAKLASVLMPDWYGDQFLKLSVPNESGLWRIQVLPTSTLGGGSVSCWGGTGIGVTKQSKHQQLAWQFLHYAYMNRANQIKRFQEIHYFPTMKAVLNDPAITSGTDPYYGGQKIGGLYASVASKVPVQYQSPYWNQVLYSGPNSVVVEYSLAMLGKKSPSQAIKDAVAGAKKIMSQPV